MTGFSTVEKAGGDEGVDLWGQSERCKQIHLTRFLRYVQGGCMVDMLIFGMQLEIDANWL